MANLELGLRGNSFKSQKQRVSLEIQNNAFANRVVNHWNKLSNDAVNAKSVNEFKTAVDKALSKHIDKYTYGLGPKWLQGMTGQDSVSQYMDRTHGCHK